MFQKHPDVGVAHLDQHIDNWEPTFWDFAARALKGDRGPFVSRLAKGHPYVKIPALIDKETVFQIWNEILEKLGPTVFDKSPRYLQTIDALDLMGEYKRLGNDVRVFAFLRDGRDAITSQYTLWRQSTPKHREIAWLKAYDNLELARQRLGFIPLFRYEDFAEAPTCYAPMILNHCGVSNVPQSFDHIKPVSVGRYSASLNPGILKWRMSEEFLHHLQSYGYKVPQFPLSKRVWLKSTIGARSLVLTVIKSLPQPAQTPLQQVKRALFQK